MFFEGGVAEAVAASRQEVKPLVVLLTGEAEDRRSLLGGAPRLVSALARCVPAAASRRRRRRRLPPTPLPPTAKPRPESQASTMAAARCRMR